MSPLRSLAALLPLLSAAAGCVYYDAYLATQLSDTQFATYEAQAETYFYCVNAVPACNETERRRIDGSCNNLLQPSAGAGHARFLRIAPSEFQTSENGSVYSVRAARSGAALPGARRLRTRLLAEGRVPGQLFTQLMMLFFVFSATDIAAMSLHDIMNYVQNHPACCLAAGAADPVCAPIPVPADDPVHRFSGVSCFNMTWPISFQSTGCLQATTKPERINYGTPFFDLSAMYGNDASTALRQRHGTGGLLKFSLTGAGRHWPLVDTTIASNATLDGIEGLVGITFIFGLFFWREHNRLATALSTLNPCWTDTQLFDTARDINIAAFDQILYYELLATLMGKANLQTSGVLATDEGFRDLYDASVTPQLSLEALTSLRWVHTFQEGMLKLYDANGTLTGEIPEVSLALNTAALQTQATNIQYFAQGAFRQATGKIDNIVDPIVGNLGFGRLQFSTDATSSDMAKTRLMGLAPYVDYLSYCTGRNFSSFDDLADHIDEEKLNLLREMYTDVRDVDLMAGLWSEQLVAGGGHVPATFYCLVTEQLKRSVVSDRHWFERASRPHAFTAAQLAEVRKASVARLMCDNADSVVEIQPRAFQVIATDNPLTACSAIPALDLSAWTDASCASS